MTWRIIREVPASKNSEMREINSGSNIFSRERAEEIAAKYLAWGVVDGATFRVEEEPTEN